MERFTTFLFCVIFSNLFITSRAGCLQPSACISTFPSSIVNMSQLCNDGYGYTFVNVTTGLQYRFEICGSIDPQVSSAPGCNSETGPCTISGAKQTNTYCNPEYNAYPFEGSFLQFFDPNPATDCKRGACPNTGFLSPTLQNQQDYCCTGQCEIADFANPFIVEYINGPGSGVQWKSNSPPPPDNGDEFQCPIDPFTGNPRSRQTNYIMYCNANGSITDPLQTIAAYENGSCQYYLVMSHFIACGTSILPTPSPTSSPSSTPTPTTSATSTPTPTPSSSPSPSNAADPTSNNSINDSFSKSIPLITSMSLASFFGSIVLAGIAIYCCNKLRTYGDDEDERNEPLLQGVAKQSLFIKSIPKLNQVQAAARLNPVAGVGGEAGGGEGGGGYGTNIPKELTDEQIYIRRLPKKFKEYLEKQGAVDPSTGTVLKQIQIKEDQLMKLRALGVSNVVLAELETTYKVISLSDA